MYPKSRFCSILQQPSLDVVGMLDIRARLEATCTPPIHTNNLSNTWQIIVYKAPKHCIELNKRGESSYPRKMMC